MKLRLATVPATAVIALLMLPIGSTAHASTWTSVESLAGHHPISVIVDGKPRNYFRLTPDQPLVVPGDGPGRLRIYSRAEFAKGANGVVSYTLRVMDGKHELEHEDTETSPSDRVHLAASGAAVGKSRRLTVDVPQGASDLRLEVSGVSSMLVRLQRAAALRNGVTMVSLTPVDAWRSVLVAEGEKSIPYYSIAVGKPVRVRVVGPTTLEVMTRLDFDASMRGTQPYQVSVTERSKRIRNTQFKTTKATTATYLNLQDRVPSKFDRFSLPVPAGTHEFLIDLVAPAGKTAEVHVRMPEPTVGHVE